jgi:hypothetical protein
MEETPYGFSEEWKFSVLFPGTIIDLETSGLDPSMEILTFGYFTGGVIKIHQFAKDDAELQTEFRKMISDTMRFLPRPFYAYNSSFEESWLKTKFDIDLMDNWKKMTQRVRKPGYKWCRKHRWVKAEDSQCPYCGHDLKNEPKWPRAEELVSLPHKYFGIEIEAMGHDVPVLWEEFKQTGDRELLNKVVYHNLYDLLRESCLLLWDESVTSFYANMLGEEKGKPRRRF